MVHGPGGHVYQSTAWADAARDARLASRASCMLDDELGALVLVRPTRWIGGGSAYVPRGPIADAGRARAAIGARLAALAEHLAATTASTSSPATPRSPRPTAGLGRGPARHRVPRHPGDPAVAPPGQPGPRRRHRRCRGPGRRSRSRPASASMPRSGRGSSSGATTPPAGTAAIRSSTARTARSTRPSAAFATLLEGTGQRTRLPVRAARRVHRLVARAPTPRACVVYLEARDDGDGARRPAPVSPRRPALDGPLGRRPGRPRHAIPGSCTCSAGGPSSWPSARGARRWTSAASTSARTTANPRRGDDMAGLYEHKRSFGAHLGRDGRRPRAGHPAVARIGSAG